MKKNKFKDTFLENLRTVPIVEVSANKAGISRKSIYKWRKSDKKFATDMDEAMTEGVEFINDMSEGSLLNLIKEKSWPALAFWLKTRNPKFKDKVEVTTKVEQETLTAEQEILVKKALAFGISNNSKNKNEK